MKARAWVKGAVLAGLLAVGLAPSRAIAQEGVPQSAPVEGTPPATSADEAEPEPVLRTSADGVPAAPSVEPAPREPDVRAQLTKRSEGESLGDVVRGSRAGLPWVVETGIQTFGEYRLTFTESAEGGTDWFHEFDVPRTWAWLSLRVGDAIGRVLLEGTRSGGEGAIVGVGGDSLVLRLREAWAGYRLLEMFEIRVGLIPQLVTPALSGLWGLRPVAPIALRNFGRFELMQPADLGASVRFDIPDGFGTIQVAYLNGEGYRSRELNRGKTLEVMAQVRPLAFLDGAESLVLTLGYQNGSTGVGSARNDRLPFGVAWADPRWGVGIEGAWVLGLEDRGDREGVLVEAWGRVEPFDDLPLLAGARFAYFVIDTQAGASSTSASTLTAAVGARIATPLRAFVAVDGRFADDAFASAVPGFERWNLRVVVEGDLGGRFEGSL